MKKYSLFFQIAILLSILLLGINNLINYYKYTLSIWDPTRINKDAASEWQNRLERISRDLPERGVVGYISEIDYPNIPYSPTDQDEEFVLSQYTLAPLILDRGNTGNHKWVMGNLSGDYEYDFEKTFSLKTIMAYGNGIYWFEKVKK